MRRIVALFVAMLIVTAMSATPVLAQEATDTEVIQAPEPVPVEGETASGGTVEGTIQNATLTVNPETETVTVDGTLVGEVTQPSGTEVPISEPITETTDLTQETAGTTCDIGSITLDGTLIVSLLGLNLNITSLDVQLTGDPSGGLLGTLLCGLAGTPTPPPA